MAIVSSQIVEDRAQIDGRRSIREQHTDQLGKLYFYAYLAEAMADAAAIMAARVTSINAWLIQNEMDQDIAYILVGNYAAVTSQYAALADIRVALRNFYKTASGQDVGRMAGFLLTLTDGQLRTIFNMTQAEVDALKVRLQNRFDALNAVLAATGE